MLKFVKQLTDFQYHRVSFAKCTQLERSPGTDTGHACGFAVGEMKPKSQWSTQTGLRDIPKSGFIHSQETIYKRELIWSSWIRSAQTKSPHGLTYKYNPHTNQPIAGLQLNKHPIYLPLCQWLYLTFKKAIIEDKIQPTGQLSFYLIIHHSG